MLTVLERRCLDLSEAIEQLSEKQELLGTLMESKKGLEKGAPERFHEKIFQRVEGVGGAEVKRGSGAVGTQAQVGKLKKERDRARDVTGEGAARGRGWFHCCHRSVSLLFLLALCGA